MKSLIHLITLKQIWQFKNYFDYFVRKFGSFVGLINFTKLLMASFDERSGVVACVQKWGSWWQTIDEIHIEINRQDRTNSKEIDCKISSDYLRCSIKGEKIIEGNLFNTVRPGDSTWTLEDKRTVRILLAKAQPNASNCWRALLKGAGENYEADDYTFDRMQAKLTLERFQNEQPGFDFSGAEISGNYQSGGPQLPN